MPQRNNPYLGMMAALPRMTAAQFSHGRGVAGADIRLYHDASRHLKHFAVFKDDQPLPSRPARCLCAGLVAIALSGCGVTHELGLTGTAPDAALGQTNVAAPVFGYAVADEPQAALVAQQILNAGGNAADAAAAAGFALSVTLPSRAGLGGGGACLIAMPDTPPTMLSFPAGRPSAAGDRTAGVPAMARGLLALQVKYGVLPYASTIIPAERLAAASPVSPALAADMQVVGSALLSDPAAAAVFGPGGTLLPVGAILTQPELAATFEVLRVQGIAGLTRGNFAPRLVAAADAAGAGLTMADLDRPLPGFAPPVAMGYGDAKTYSLPAATDTSGPSPATASFAALDKNGGAVACATSMNNLFGTGRIAAGTGILLAAAPGLGPPPILAAHITTNGNGRVTTITTGTGDAAVSRANTISCPGGIPGAEASCRASADPHGQGLAVGGR
jgi:gamma-glutamyltranspeptidase/glutathione hydrolase